MYRSRGRADRTLPRVRLRDGDRRSDRRITRSLLAEGGPATHFGASLGDLARTHKNLARTRQLGANQLSLYGVGMPLVISKWEDHTAPRKDGLIRPDGHAGIAGSTGQSMIQVRRSGSNLVASSVCIRGSRGLPLGAATWTAVHTARAAGARAAAQPPAAAT